MVSCYHPKQIVGGAWERLVFEVEVTSMKAYLNTHGWGVVSEGWLDPFFCKLMFYLLHLLKKKTFKL